MSLKHVMLAGGIAAAMVLTGSLAPVVANPSGGSSSSGSSGPPTKCREGWVYNDEKKICERAQSGVFDDDELYAQGEALALAGHYTNALAVLDAIEDKNDAMVLTMIGYSTRKLGDFEGGIAYYKQALAIEPDNLNTYEYLGEAYVSLGRNDLAGVQLDRIETICGSTTCEPFVALTDFMAGNGTWH